MYLVLFRSGYLGNRSLTGTLPSTTLRDSTYSNCMVFFLVVGSQVAHLFEFTNTVHPGKLG